MFQRFRRTRLNTHLRALVRETNVTTNWQYSQSSKVGYMSYLTSNYRSKKKKICLNSLAS